jgi:hypothetical protein
MTTATTTTIADLGNQSAKLSLKFYPPEAFALSTKRLDLEDLPPMNVDEAARRLAEVVADRMDGELMSFERDRLIELAKADFRETIMGDTLNVRRPKRFDPPPPAKPAFSLTPARRKYR